LRRSSPVLLWPRAGKAASRKIASRHENPCMVELPTTLMMLTASADSSSFFARFQAAAGGGSASQRAADDFRMILQIADKDLTNRPGRSGILAGRFGFSRFTLFGLDFHTRTRKRFPAAENRIAVFTPSSRGNEGKWALVPQGVRVPVLYLAQTSHDLRDFFVSGCSPCHCVTSALGIPSQLNCYNPWYQTGQQFLLSPNCAQRHGAEVTMNASCRNLDQRHEMSFLRICQ
jgi:hypothetical protein